MPPDPAPSTVDVVVLGGGPAGASAASLLSSWGHDVTLVTRGTPPASGLAESIPPSARSLLDRVGVLPRMEAAGFAGNGGNTVWWAGGRERREAFGTDQPGFLAERSALERVFHEHAEAAGVQLLKGTVRRVERAESGVDDRVAWVVDAGEGRTLRARWVLDATGRAGILAKRGLRALDVSTPTLALVRRWRSGTPDPRPTHTLVESYRDGWAWSVPLSGRERCVTAMVDPRLTALRADAGITEMYRSELGKTRHLKAFTEDAEPLGEAWACPASLYGALAFGGPGFLLVGDAGSFIDPLSSYGVKKALASGWLAAVTVHTALLDPSMEEEARSFHDRRERTVYRSYRRLGGPFFREAAVAYGHPFWECRAVAAQAAGDSAPSSDPADRLASSEDDDDLPDRQRVEQEWSALRARDRLEAEAGVTLRVIRRPALQGNRIVLADHVASEACPGGIRWVRGVQLTELVREAPEHATVPDLYEACARRQPTLDLPSFLTALSTAFAAGFLQRARAAPEGGGVPTS